MKNPKTFLLLSVIVGVLLLGVAYAAIQNITLTVSGTATATPDQGNFSVKFTGTPDYGGDGTITAKITGDLTATFTVTGLTKIGDEAVVNFSIENHSTDLFAELSYNITHTNSEYFEVTGFIGSNYDVIPSLNVLASTSQIGIHQNRGQVSVRVMLKKLPIGADVSDTITVKVTAKPIQAIS